MCFAGNPCSGSDKQVRKIIKQKWACNIMIYKIKQHGLFYEKAHFISSKNKAKIMCVKNNEHVMCMILRDVLLRSIRKVKMSSWSSKSFIKMNSACRTFCCTFFYFYFNIQVFFFIQRHVFLVMYLIKIHLCCDILHNGATLWDRLKFGSNCVRPLNNNSVIRKKELSKWINRFQQN